ncbi:MAG: superoxide dismutase [Parcubacteria group bacterium]|nr:superoxide dismutase [Parcubacteria group bacterium]
MHSYTEQKFDIPDLMGLSAKQLEEHLKLYAGYVKHVNLIREKIHELEADKEKNAYLISELRRRFSFEFNGMRMHEYYFEGFEGGFAEAEHDTALASSLALKHGSFENWVEHFKTVGMTRGIGWAVLYVDPKARQPHTVWVGDHELGTLAGLPILLALDMWEHAYMIDYAPSEKKNYIEAFFSNLNWGVVEKRFGKNK